MATHGASTRAVTDINVSDPTPLGTGPPSMETPADPARSPSRGRMIGASVAAVALLVSTLVFAALWNSEKGSGGDRSAVASASGRFAERFLTLDSRDPNRTEQAVLPLATGAFRRTFRQGFEAGLVPALVSIGKVKTQASVKEVFIGDLDRDSAHVIVHVGVVAHPIDQPKLASARPDSWIELDLVKQGSRWLIDGVGDLKIGSDTSTPGGGAGATAPPTAPTPTSR